MADLAGPQKINFVCMKLYMQFVYKLATQPHYFYKKNNCSTICISQEYVVGFKYNKPPINSMTASCGNFLKKRDKRVRQEHSDLYYCTKCFYFSLKCTKIVSSWGSAPYRPRWGAYIRSSMVLREGGEGEMKEMRF